MKSVHPDVPKPIGYIVLRYMVDGLSSGLCRARVRRLLEDSLIEQLRCLLKFLNGLIQKLWGNICDQPGSMPSWPCPPPGALRPKAALPGDAALELAKLYMVSQKESEKIREYLRAVIVSENACEASKIEAMDLLTKYSEPDNE